MRAGSLPVSADQKRLPKKWREWPLGGYPTVTGRSQSKKELLWKEAAGAPQGGRLASFKAAGAPKGGRLASYKAAGSPKGGRLASFGAAGAPKGGRLASFEALERLAGLAIVGALGRPAGQALEAARSKGVWRQLWRRLPHVRAALWRWSIEKKQKAGRGRGLMFCPHRISIKQSLQQHFRQILPADL